MLKRIPLFIFFSCVFLSAFLLFQMQPIIGKYMLPLFGGTAAVWTTSLLFFQSMLLLGYLYSFLILRIPLRRHVKVHVTIVLAIAVLMVIFFLSRPSPILPPLMLPLPKDVSPLVQVLFFLLISVGFPYFLLSTTSTLLQKWFHYSYPARSPYPLYAFSNAASLLGLLSYPFLVEPVISLSQQGALWTGGFFIYCSLLTFCSFFMFVKIKRQPAQKAVKKSDMETNARLGAQHYALWIFLSALPSLMLAALTNILTQIIAPAPFLWLLPLSLYLLSFILCFSHASFYRRTLFTLIFISLAMIATILIQQPPNFAAAISLYSLVMFSCFMLCHGELYALRPHPQYLERFYLLTAVGGVLGTLIVAVIAPLFFNTIWEVYIGIGLTFILASVLFLTQGPQFVQRFIYKRFPSKREALIATTAAASIAVIVFAILLQTGKENVILAKKRNFYGILTVAETPDRSFRIISHGKILHGGQYKDPVFAHKPVMYYEDNTGLGLALKHLQTQKDTNLRIGVIGLGAGMLTVYGREGDFIRFYDIDPNVVLLAQTYFTYLNDAKADVDIVLQDGRLALEEETKNPGEKPYDIIILDAFSGDAIPIHLLTKEAFGIYLQRLQPDGVLAVHISNSFMDLSPIVKRIAQHYGLEYTTTLTKSEKSALYSHWVILSKDTSLFQSPAMKKAAIKHAPDKSVDMWTDNYSNLLQVLK